MQPEPLPPNPVILFDGTCRLCNGVVQFVVRRDPGGRFRFLPIQSARGSAAYRAAGLDPERPDTLAVWLDGSAYTRSDAVLVIAGGLGWPWSMAKAGSVLPRRLRDWLYDVVARNRYRIFGRYEACLLPTPEIRSRFLE